MKYEPWLPTLGVSEVARMQHSAGYRLPRAFRYSRPRALTPAMACLLALALAITPTMQASASEVGLHGADSVFVAPDVAVVWAVLKQAQVDKATVWLRLVNTTRKFTHYSIDGVDPFSKKRERVDKGMAIATEVRVDSDRETFADLTSREIHLYSSEADWKGDKPALTVYYLGVPDTTPEFVDRVAMDAYLSKVSLLQHKAEVKR